MSAPLFLVEALPTGRFFTLDGPEGHHAATVQRLRAGETVILGDGHGGTMQATVAVAGRGVLELELGAAKYIVGPDPRLAVVQAIAKGERGELAVQAMTEVGVDIIVPWSASRAVAQWHGERGVRARQKWVQTAREATKQCRRAWLPEICVAASTSDVCDRLARASRALVLHEGAHGPLTSVDLPDAGEVVVVVGPEGGISPDELEVFSAAGALPVRLGRSVLRTSTAGVAALAVLSARLGRW